MATKGHNFKLSGPTHLANINWSDPNHRRCIVASLVQGVYVLERDRQELRRGLNALADKWWTFFNFQLLEKANDGKSIFAAVYVWNGEASTPYAPKIVVAFRGTIGYNCDSFLTDMNSTLQIPRNGLHETTRFRKALDLVHKYVSEHSAKNVWIAGHSLGAAIAMLVGRHMAEDGYLLQAHLFNPPFISPLVDRMSFHWGLYAARDLVTLVLAMAVTDKRSRIESHQAFLSLRSWVPHLYVNTMDDICSAYVPYFAHQKMMQRIGASRIASVAAKYTISNVVQSAVGIESKAFYRIPAAWVAVNDLVPSPDFGRSDRAREWWADLRTAHSIRQWWAPNLSIQYSEFRISEVPGLMKQMTFAMLGIASGMLGVDDGRRYL